MIEKRFNIQEQFRAKFYQLPKVLFTNEKYMKLSNDAKVAYAILQDRLELSIKNEWFNENGDIYFIYTNEKLKEILNCQNSKLSKIKNELINVDLLEQIRTGQGKPNQLYLNRPIIESSDVYKIKNQESDVAEDRHDKDVRKSDVKKSENQTSRNPKIGRQEIRKSDANNTKFSNTEFIETELNDTTTTNHKHSSSSNITQWLKIIQNDLNIEMTAKYKKDLSNLLEKFNNDIIAYAIEHTSLHAKNPKPFILKILQKWEENNIKTVKQAKEFKVNKNVINFSREKTPEWLKNRDKQSENEKEMTKEEQAKFEKERNEFRKQLKEYWGEDRND
ncbi:replication initiator protein A (plasmid) [Staphylococcus haemolyticus]|uniref:replication initiator protein A n=1 Tax=Staphylococcus haemolyticus TaxID=1283 RepID=UPI001C480010|nr:replication initiator protein A [Staphylococcus haemolyticus]MCG1090289.1 replication initiator protein A [Staphylococcus epidermidis]QXN79055.1 replication initiator protein A [Staphylococcus haemolyticus]